MCRNARRISHPRLRMHHAQARRGSHDPECITPSSLTDAFRPDAEPSNGQETEANKENIYGAPRLRATLNASRYCSKKRRLFAARLVCTKASLPRSPTLITIGLCIFSITRPRSTPKTCCAPWRRAGADRRLDAEDTQEKAERRLH